MEPLDGMTRVNTQYVLWAALDEAVPVVTIKSVETSILGLKWFAKPSKKHAQFAAFLGRECDRDGDEEISKEEFMTAIIAGVLAFDDDNFAWTRV